MARRPRDPPQVDLAQFSAAECARIWEVLQKDFRLRFREEQRLERLKSQLAKAGEKVKTLGKDPNFNEKYCVICFRSFVFLFNPKERCFVCLCNVCHSCSRYIATHERWLCQLCEEERTVAAKQCLWFYDGSAKEFVVGGQLPPTSAPEAHDVNGDPLTEQMRRYLQEFVTRYKQEDDMNTSEEGIEANVARRNFSELPVKPARGQLREEVLKRITAHQVMRFHQKISSLTGDVESFLRKDVRYEIPEAGVNALYDQNMETFRSTLTNILRNFSQTLYIAIEGHHSKTGERVDDVQLGVQQILQDEVESLVGCRVDIPTDDDAMSMVSDDFGNANDQGLTIHDRLSDVLISKWLNDHQTFLDDQQLTANDLYKETALERVLAQKSERRDYGEHPSGLFGMEVDPDLLSAGGAAQFESNFHTARGLDSPDAARRTVLSGSISSSGSGANNWLLGGRPAANCGDSLRGFTRRNEQADDFSDSNWKDLGELDEGSSEEEASGSSCSLPVTVPSRPLDDRKISVASLDFDDVYRRNLTLAKETETPRERLEQSSRSEDSGVNVTSSSPPASSHSIDHKPSLGFSRMDWSFNERSDPHFVAKPPVVDVEAGECATITVEADGTPPIDIFWHRCSPDELLQLEEVDRVEFLSAPDHPGKSSLLLWDVRTEDEGEYLATAVNEKGSSQQGFKIIVTDRTGPLQAPEFLQEVSDEFVREGDVVRLHCKVQGCPQPRVQFLRRGVPIRNSEKFAIKHIGERSVSLAIHDFREEDEGEYICLATNSAGKVKCKAQVRISTSGYRLTRHSKRPPQLKQNTADLFTADSGPSVDHSPAVKVRDQVSRLTLQDGGDQSSSHFQDRIEPPCRPSARAMQFAEPKRRSEASNERLKSEGPPAPSASRQRAAKTDEVDAAAIPPLDRSDAGVIEKRGGSSHRKNFHVNGSPMEGEDRERRARRVRAEREREEKEEKEREEKKRKEKEEKEIRKKEEEARRTRIEKVEQEREEKEKQEREEKKRKEKEEKERRKKEAETRRTRIEKVEREKEEKERREKEEKERREREREERLEKEVQERRLKLEREKLKKEEEERKQRVEIERRESVEKEKRQEEEREKRRREEERRRRREEEERTERIERRAKERKGREEKEKREREERERLEKEEKERKEIEERIRLRRLEREEREREEEERRAREEEERKERGGEEEEKFEAMEEGERLEVASSVPSICVEEEFESPDEVRSLQSPWRGSASPGRQDTVADITTLIESGRLRSFFQPNMFASFRTRKFPSVPEIRNQFSRRGAYTKRPPPVPVKISGERPKVKKVYETPSDSSQSAVEDFRTVKLKATGVNLKN